MTKSTMKETLLTPEKYYKVPADVSADTRWSTVQKREILQAWKSNEEALLRAADEGLDGGERPHLRKVTEELEKFDGVS